MGNQSSADQNLITDPNYHEAEHSIHGHDSKDKKDWMSEIAISMVSTQIIFGRNCSGIDCVFQGFGGNRDKQGCVMRLMKIKSKMCETS